MRKTIRLTVVSAIAAGALTASAGAAFADDCFNASRSAQGNTSAAAHSSNWWSVGEMLTNFLGLTPDQVAQVLAVVNKDPRIPQNLTIFIMPSQGGQAFELAQNAPAPLMVNGKGIDHSDDYPAIWSSLFEDIASVIPGVGA